MKLNSQAIFPNKKLRVCVKNHTSSDICVNFMVILDFRNQVYGVRSVIAHNLIFGMSGYAHRFTPVTFEAR